MRTVRRTAAVWIVSAGALLVTPAFALASPGWSAPSALGVPGGSAETTISYGTGGVATVAYVQITSQSPIATALHVGTIAPGGSYVDQLTIPSTADALPAAVSLSEAPDGAAVIEYETIASVTPATSDAGVYAMSRPAGSSTWENPVTVTPPTPRSASDGILPVTAIAADGTAAAAVERPDSTDASPGGDRIDVAVLSHGSWGSPTEISVPGDDNESLELAFDSADNLTAAFTSAVPAGTERPTAEVATRSGSAGVWGAPVMVSAPSNTDFLGSPLQLGVAPDGSAVVAYQLVSAGNTLDAWATTRSGASGGWNTPVDLTPGSASAAPRAVGVSPSDKAYVVYEYQGTNSVLNCIGVVRASVGGTFSAPRCASALNDQPGSIAGVTFLGNDAYFAFSGEPNGGSARDLEADRWTDVAAAPDSPTTVVSPGSANPGILTIEPDGDGGVPLIYTVDNGATYDASAWDTAGPSLVSSSVPTMALAGQPVALSESFSDLWSNPVTAPIWNFGDGTSATGASVSHTYGAPGTYTVDAVSADSLGNTTTTPFTITVTAAPASPTPPTPTSTATSTGTTSTTESTPVPAAPTTVAPKLTAVTQTHASWLEKRRSHAKGTQPSVGSVFHFTLSTTASVTVTFTGTRSGRRVAKKCVTQTRANARKPKCTLSFSETETISGHSGVNALSFRGAVAGHGTLTPGRYTVTFVAQSGSLRSASSRLHFTILAT